LKARSSAPEEVDVVFEKRRLITIVCVSVLATLVTTRCAAAQTTKDPKASQREANSAPAGHVTIEKPKPRTVTGGGCRILSDGTFSGSWGPPQLPTLGFTIGPHATMAQEMHASKKPFTGPGRYPDEIIAVYLGKTALEDSYGGLGTITVNPDGRTGSFVLNDRKASGTWDCGPSAAR